MKKNKTFDCVEMQHKGAERLREKLSSMTREEQLVYFQRRTKELKERQESLRKVRNTD